MSILDRLFPKTDEQEHAINYSPSNEQAAWFAIVYSAAYIDGKVSDKENTSYIKLLEMKELFKGHRVLDYFYEVGPVMEKISAIDVIDEAAKKIDPNNAPTLFCIVAETILTEGVLTEKEEEILEYIRRALAVDANLASKTIEIMLIKNKGNLKI